MARITVDDCIKFLPNRFELTLAATNRARQIALGATPQVEPNKDKPTVIALREIAAGSRCVEPTLPRPSRSAWRAPAKKSRMFLNLNI